MIAILLAAQVVSSSPPLAPAEAAAVLARLDTPANRTNVFVCGDCDGPRVIVIPSRLGEGPFGPFPRYRFPPPNCWSVYISGVPWFGPLPSRWPPARRDGQRQPGVGSAGMRAGAGIAVESGCSR